MMILTQYDYEFVVKERKFTLKNLRLLLCFNVRKYCLKCHRIIDMPHRFIIIYFFVVFRCNNG